MLIMPSEIRINVRTTAQIKRDLEITAKLRGMTVSSLVNSMAVKVIREEKQMEPEAFNTSTVSRGLRASRLKVEPPNKLRKTG